MPATRHPDDHILAARRVPLEFDDVLPYGEAGRCGNGAEKEAVEFKGQELAGVHGDPPSTLLGYATTGCVSRLGRTRYGYK
jgi:hypothetical protein